MARTQTVDQAVSQTYLSATGKTTTLTLGSAKYTKILSLFNIYTQVWANDPETNWSSLRNVFTLASTVSATDTYALPASLGKLSDSEGDFVRIYHTDGVTESDYTIVPIDRLYNDLPTRNNYGIDIIGTGTCAVVGQNLVFSRAFTSANTQFGGTIKVPGYSIPPTLVSGTDVIRVDDPNWLCFIAAAEYVRTDVTRVGQYPNLIAQATDSMNSMKLINNSQNETAYRGAFRPLGMTF